MYNILKNYIQKLKYKYYCKKIYITTKMHI